MLIMQHWLLKFLVNFISIETTESNVSMRHRVRGYDYAFHCLFLSSNLSPPFSLFLFFLYHFSLFDFPFLYYSFSISANWTYILNRCCNSHIATVPYSILVICVFLFLWRFRGFASSERCQTYWYRQLSNCPNPAQLIRWIYPIHFMPTTHLYSHKRTTAQHTAFK